MAAAEISQLGCESHGLIGNGNLCFHVWEAVSFAKDHSPLWWNPGYRPVKMKPDQKEAFLLLLGLPINPLYLRLARTSPFLFPWKGQAPRMVRSRLTAILPPNTQERDPHPPLIILSVTSSVFPPALSSPPARLLAWLEWAEKKKKRVSKAIGTRAPNLFLESVFFFLSKQKSHREK